ncbi:MAG TPA: class I SAM-dependent methyltransferase [Alphaproteobacteria bacterium]|nr:class I SAM-dependent methyltransferase [Alphaproteobacteria bacterium]HOO49924.1 class I SAM-dependent methyltransferase [Alphaproteobacteria bacterium]
MLDEHYTNPKLAEIYDIDSGWSVDRDFYLSLADPSKKLEILDLGCGTGLLCDAYAARGHSVTGCDPSKTMLDVARLKPHGKNIEWVESSAQDFKSLKSFDLIVMTGHAFQVLLSEEDILIALSNMKRHLKTGGLIVFEARNPAVNWVECWDYSMSLDTKFGSVEESRKFLNWDGQRMSFELVYKFPNETFISKSDLLFLSKNKICDLLIASGLVADSVFGGWDKSPFYPDFSKEMIFFVRHN